MQNVSGRGNREISEWIYEWIYGCFKVYLEINIFQINLKASIMHGMAQYNYTEFRTKFVMEV